MPSTVIKFLDPSDLSGGKGVGSNAATLTPRAGGGQGPKANIFTGVTRVINIANSGDSLTLPKAYRGSSLLICNRDGGQSLNIFPFKGNKINGAPANTPYALPFHKTVIMFCVLPGNWNTMSAGV